MASHDMILRYKVETLDDVEEAHRQLYKEHDSNGKTVYILQVEGAVPAERAKDLTKKVDQFRKNNNQLAESVKALLDAAGIELDDPEATPDQLAKMLTEKQKENEDAIRKAAKGGSQEEIDKMVNQRVEAYKTNAEAQTKKLQDALKEEQEKGTQLFNQLENMMVANAVVEAGSQRGLKGTAHQDLIYRARKIFKFRDGEVRALQDDGETPVYGADGVNEMTIPEWVEAQASKEAPHLFEASSGGGAPGSSGGAGRNGAVSGPNPWKEGSVDKTRQMMLIRKDPALAKKMAAEAGVKLPDIKVASGR